MLGIKKVGNKLKRNNYSLHVFHILLEIPRSCILFLSPGKHISKSKDALSLLLYSILFPAVKIELFHSFNGSGSTDKWKSFPHLLLQDIFIFRGSLYWSEKRALWRELIEEQQQSLFHSHFIGSGCQKVYCCLFLWKIVSYNSLIDMSLATWKILGFAKSAVLLQSARRTGKSSNIFYNAWWFLGYFA